MRISLIALAAGGLFGCTSTPSGSKPQLERASDLNLEIGIDYLRKGHLAQAKDKIDRALEQNPRSAKAHGGAGLLYDQLGDKRKADSHFERALSLDARNPEIANNYAAFLCRNDRHERGERYALQAATNPLYSTPEIAFSNAGNCARAAGNLTRAEEHYRRALTTKPRFALALYQMADLEHAQKNYLSARAFLERYLEVARTSPSTLWLGVRIERGLGNAAGADAYARRLKNEYPTAAETKELLESDRNPG